MAIVDIALEGWFVASQAVVVGHLDRAAVAQDFVDLALDAAIEDGQLSASDRRDAVCRIRDGDTLWQIREAKVGYEVISWRLAGGPETHVGDFATEVLANAWLLQHLGFGAGA